MRWLVEPWFECMRACGPDVQEILHDGQPTACVDDIAFGYVDAFSGHANVGFFNGADLDDPSRLLQGTGRHMRHIKLRPDQDVDGRALRLLIETAYHEARSLRDGVGKAAPSPDTAS